MSVGRLTADSVEALLQARYEPSESDCPGLLDIAEATAGDADETLRRRAREHLVDCPDCAAALLVAAGEEEPASAGAPRLRRRVAIAAAAAVAIVAGTTALLVDRPAGPGPSDGRLVRKGPGDTLAVAVLREGRPHWVRAGERLGDGEHVGLFYSAAAPGHLVVLHVDAEARATVVAPVSGNTPLSVVPGELAPLEDGAVMTPGAGCEWFVAVFSSLPLSPERVAEQVGRADTSRAGCDLAVSVPGARSVRVLPVRR